MNWITEIISPLLIEALGWTLLHSLWQGIVIMSALGLALAFISANASRLRYFLSISAAFFMLFWTGFTFFQEYQFAVDAHADGVVVQQSLTLWAVTEPEIAGEVSLQSWILDRIDSIPSLLTPAIPWVTFGWLLGFAIFSVRWVGGIIYLRHLRTHDIIPVAYLWQLKVNKLARKMGIGKTILLRESSKVNVPMVIGHLRPIILIPLGILNGLTPAQLEAIFAHELAHIQRYDFIINLILSQIEALFFYHPAFWWISRQIRDEREHCCDDIAISICKDPVSYARTLANLEAQKLQTVPLSMGFAGRKNHLLTRIQRIVMPNLNNSQSGPRAFFALLLVVFLTGTAWMSPTQEVVATSTNVEEIFPIPAQLFPDIAPDVEATVPNPFFPEAPAPAEFTDAVPPVVSIKTPSWNFTFVDSPPPAYFAPRPRFPENNQNSFDFNQFFDSEVDWQQFSQNGFWDSIASSKYYIDAEQYQNNQQYFQDAYQQYFQGYQDSWANWLDANKQSMDQDKYYEALRAYERAIAALQRKYSDYQREGAEREREKLHRLEENMARLQQRYSDREREELEKEQERMQRLEEEMDRVRESRGRDEERAYREVLRAQEREMERSLRDQEIVMEELQRRAEEIAREREYSERQNEVRRFEEREREDVARELRALEGQLNEMQKLAQLKELEKLAQLNQLQDLAQLKELKKLKELKALEDLSQLKELNKLKELQGLAQLKELEKLTELNALQEIKGLEQLTELQSLIANDIDEGSMDGFKATFSATLRVDGYINDNTDLIKVRVYNNMLKINGQKLTGDDFDRYMELMQEYGLDLSPGTNITVLLD